MFLLSSPLSRLHSPRNGAVALHASALLGATIASGPGGSGGGAGPHTHRLWVQARVYWGGAALGCWRVLHSRQWWALQAPQAFQLLPGRPALLPCSLPRLLCGSLPRLLAISSFSYL